MITKAQLDSLRTRGRQIQKASAAPRQVAGLGPLQGLQRTWKSLPGHGWNMIALPFAGTPKQPNPLHYRLLLNQFDETLDFLLVDTAVPNRGIDGASPPSQTDQFLGAISYVQDIHQIAAADEPVSGQAGPADLPIHHEPGLWLNILNQQTPGVEIGRLASVPHGDSVMALGTSEVVKGAAKIPDISGLPIGVSQDLNSKYLAPYRHFHDNLFQGVFDPVHPNLLLRRANQGVDIARPTVLHVDTQTATGGIHNIPFIEKQADAERMVSTFWIQELAETDSDGEPKLRLQYSQTVFLEFFDRPDGKGRIIWPHVSIDTLVPST